jgi:hypothetical protein
MNTLLSVLFLILVCLFLPAIVLGWATESRSGRIRRLSASGMSQRAIATRLGITRHRVRLALS